MGQLLARPVIAVDKSKVNLRSMVIPTDQVGEVRALRSQIAQRDVRHPQIW